MGTILTSFENKKQKEKTPIIWPKCTACVCVCVCERSKNGCVNMLNSS